MHNKVIYSNKFSEPVLSILADTGKTAVIALIFRPRASSFGISISI
jgi:hypothetical protein